MRSPRLGSSQLCCHNQTDPEAGLWLTQKPPLMPQRRLLQIKDPRKVTRTVRPNG
jgi:hypothetical protein